MTIPHYEMELRVRYVECDMQGRVFNGHYLTWVDMASTEALDHIVGISNLQSSGVDYVVAAAELTFCQPTTFNDRLLVQVRFDPPGTASLRSEYTIMRGDERIAECAIVHVCVDGKTYEKRPWPDWLRDRVAAHSSSAQLPRASSLQQRVAGQPENAFGDGVAHDL